MEEINQELRAYVEGAILPLYAGFDEAHGPEHAGRVIENSLGLLDTAKKLYGPVDADMVYTVAAYHDTGLQFGREDHGVTSGRVLMGDENLRRWFTPEQLAVMRDAVEDHRASSGHDPRSVYGRIVSEADRDIDPFRIARRCMQYGLARYPGLSDGEQIERAVLHMKNKYAEGGYMKPAMPCKKNEEGLAKLRRLLESGEIAEICKKFLREQE